MKLDRPPHIAASFVEFPRPTAPPSSINNVERDDVLQYIQEMCVTLSYMSRAKQCQPLTILLEAAAREAGAQITSASSRPRPSDELAARSGARQAQ